MMIDLILDADDLYKDDENQTNDTNDNSNNNSNDDSKQFWILNNPSVYYYTEGLFIDVISKAYCSFSIK